MELNSKPSDDYVAAQLGVKSIYEEEGAKVKVIYQGCGAALAGLMVDDTILGVNDIYINKDFPLPDLTFVLKVSPEVCVERIKERGEGAFGKGSRA